MRKNLLWILTGISVFLCTGCFDLHEEVHLKKDGSGTYAFFTDLSQFKDFFGAFGNENKQDKAKNKNENDKDKLSADFQKLNDYLKDIDGITDAHVIADTTLFKFGVAFNFKNVTALNKALNTIYHEDNEDTDAKDKKAEEVFFELRDNSFIRYETQSTGNLLKDKGVMESVGKDSKNNPFGGLEAMFQTVSFSCTYEFDREIKSVSNESSMISSNFKKVSTTCHPFAKDTKENTACSLTNIITFK